MLSLSLKIYNGNNKSFHIAQWISGKVLREFHQKKSADFRAFLIIHYGSQLYSPKHIPYMVNPVMYIGLICGFIVKDFSDAFFLKSF